MSNLVKFGFDGHDIQVQRDEDGTAWFCVNDICKPLEHSNSRKAVDDLVDPDDVTRRDIIDSLGRPQSANFVNESGMYALIFGSRLETAQRFKRWVTHEVLPALRKTGRYEVGQAPDAAAKRAEAMLVNARVRMHAAVLRTVDDIHRLTPLAPDALAATKAAVAAATVGTSLPLLKPATVADWFTPTQIAEQLGVTVAKVGRIITELGLRGNVDGLARAVLNKATHSDRTVTSYQYTLKAVEQIAAKLAAEPVHDA